MYPVVVVEMDFVDIFYNNGISRINIILININEINYI